MEWGLGSWWRWDEYGGGGENECGQNALHTCVKLSKNKLMKKIFLKLIFGMESHFVVLAVMDFAM